MPHLYHRTLGILLCMLALLPAAQTHAVAYCALRDPVGTIAHFYPDYTSYTAVDGTVNLEVRALLNEHLSNLHFSEFGQHTLYVVYQNGELVGYVHARTEKGDWGLDEMVWALNPDLTVSDFRFQRSRSQGRDLTESPQFVAWLNGRSVDDIVGLLDDSGNFLKSRPDFIPQSHELMATRVLRSAVKTILITGHVWPQSS